MKSFQGSKGLNIATRKSDTKFSIYIFQWNTEYEKTRDFH